MRVFFLSLSFFAVMTGALMGNPSDVRAQDAVAAAATLKTEKIVFSGKDKKPVRLIAELALDPRDQERGLMGRTSLASDHGMLFVFPKAEMARFWMRNTLIPLDMVFVNDAGRVVKVHPMAVPHDETFISSPVPVRAVLEIAGGQAALQGVAVGDVLTSKTLADAVAADKSRLVAKPVPAIKDNPPPAHGTLSSVGAKMQ